MANDFNKEERVLFEQLCEAYDDNLEVSKMVRTFNTDQAMMERTNDTIWRPMPYIGRSYDGTDATANFNDHVQLSVPARIAYHKHSTAIYNTTELRDMLQQDRMRDAVAQKLASDVNVAILTMMSNQGTLVVPVATAATGFADVALIEAMMNEQGVPYGMRYLALSTRDYNGMASNLASRQTMDRKPLTAYERAYVGTVASFETYKMDYAQRCNDASGVVGVTMSTLDAAAQYYVPVATRTAVTGETENVDNRYQTITVSSTVGITAGDAFTVAALNAVHHITKVDTGQLKTFRVISVDSGTTMTISPPMITNQVASDAGAQYQNCVINTKAANSALTFLNIAAAPINAFWHGDAFELLPGRFPVPQGSGVSVMRSTTSQGIELTMQKFYDINTSKVKYRWDIRFGVCCVNPEMCGIILFNQT